MNESDRIRYLRIALRVIGLVFIFGIGTLTIVWPAGWIWHTGHFSPYPPMIIGIYATLGVFLIYASGNPLEHKSLVWFTVWSSAVHGAIMAVESIVDPTQIGHLWGDVGALFGVAVVLAFLMPRTATVRTKQLT